MIQIKCKTCGRILGDTEKSLDAKINCKTCKKASHIKIKIVNNTSYDFLNITRKEKDE